MTESKQSICTRHPEREAVETCFTCGKDICEDCKVEHQGKVVCSVCLDEKTGIKKTAHRRAKWIVAALVLFAIISGGWFFFEKYPKIKKKALMDFIGAMEAGRPTEEVISRLPWWFDVNTKDKGGGIPLHWASGTHNSKIVKILLAHGAEVNAKGDFSTQLGGILPLRAYIRQKGITPLHLAAGIGDKKTVKLLLMHGAKVNLCSDTGNTPLDFLQKRLKPLEMERDSWINGNWKETITLLRNHGALTGAELDKEAEKKK